MTIAQTLPVRDAPPLAALRRTSRDDPWLRPSLKPCGEHPPRRVASLTYPSKSLANTSHPDSPEKSQASSRSSRIESTNLGGILSLIC
jgi:hypothetical protein